MNIQIIEVRDVKHNEIVYVSGLHNESTELGITFELKDGTKLNFAPTKAKYHVCANEKYEIEIRDLYI